MTNNLKMFAASSVVWSVSFFSVLHWALFEPDNRWPVIAIAAIAYGLGFAALGYYFGKRDDQSKVRYALSPRYAITSNIASVLIGGTWVAIWRRDEVDTLALMVLGISVQMLIFAIIYRNSIKGIKSRELFK